MFICSVLQTDAKFAIQNIVCRRIQPDLHGSFAKETCNFKFICSALQTVITMGWLRLVGSLKLQVSFAKEPCKSDYILRKRPVILRSLLIVTTSYTHISHLQILRSQYHLFYRALLQKRPVILRSLLIVATPQQHPFAKRCI